jgi:hypothetical protein
MLTFFIWGNLLKKFYVKVPNEKNILIGISKTGMYIEKCDNLYVSLIAPKTGIHIEKCDNLYIRDRNCQWFSLFYVSQFNTRNTYNFYHNLNNNLRIIIVCGFTAIMFCFT